MFQIEIFSYCISKSTHATLPSQRHIGAEAPKPDPMRAEVLLKWREDWLYLGGHPVGGVFELGTGDFEADSITFGVKRKFASEPEARSALLAAVTAALTGEAP